ncbi:Hypothetical protein, putative [Bodo saltans]|uniref:AAA+ ATPase domain-containing protein n=1 Tax=Bodo saltans TaxID=75058 RepID=A0A0S4JWN2_BODSA|nr:Hypothetical protein, putative [Bodo saltans]|eukprot:CUG93875.1 Hypothetical protein, putative [Bodo saltans]
MQQSVVVVCHVNRDTSYVTYETIIDGQNVSTENPVVVVTATDDTDPRNEIPFQRIAQYISGKTWRKCTEAGFYGAPIADKAVEVAAAVLAEYRLSDRSHELFEQNHSNFDVLKDIVYLSSKQLLYHLDALRTMIENKWKENLRRHKYEALAKEVEKLLIQDSRVLALSKPELQAVNDMLRVLKFHVNEVKVDNQSFDSKGHQLSERSKKPSISFAHIDVVGHLDPSYVERLCDLVRGSSLRLLVVASPSTQHFAKVSHILQTNDAEIAFRATRITAFAVPLCVSNRYLQELEPLATKCIENHTRRDFYIQVKQSQETHPLTIICRRGHELRPNDFLDLTREVDPLRTLREHLARPKKDESHVVAVVDNAPPTLSLFVCGDSVVDAHIMYVPKVMGRVSAGLASLVGADPAITLSPEWQAVQDKMSQRLKEAIDFTDFVAIVPCCEWLDHRSRVQLYFLVVWGVPLGVTKQVLPAIRNVMSLPLAQTLMLSRESMRQKSQQIESLPSYHELVVGGTVTLSDVLQTSISYRVDIPWNLCYHQWRIAAPFSSSELTQILSVYAYPLRLLATLGSSIFHTLSGVELFAPSTGSNDAANNKAASGVPMLWAVNVAKRLAAASKMLSRDDDDDMIPREHLTALSVMKWLFIIRGWNAIDPIVFDGADFSTLDGENIAMDILRADPEATAASSKRASMSQHTRHNVALMLATICGSPTLFSKQPQVVDYFLRPSSKGGITTESATALFDELLDPNNDLMIGAPFLSILKDSSLLNASALRRITAVNELWCWCNNSSTTTTSASPSKDQTTGGEQQIGNGLRKISEKFSSNAWGYLLATADTRQKTKKVVELLQSRKRDREILVPTMLNAAGLFASEVPTALDAITTVFLSTMADEEGDDFSTFRRNCPSLVHVLDLLFSSQKESKTTFDPMEYARKSLPGSPGVQFKVELEDSDKVLTFCLLQLNFFSDEAVESEFANAVLFFGRCLTEHDRHCFLRNVTDLLLDSTSTTPGQMEPCLNIRQPTRRRLQVAAAVLWLHCPMAPCPLSTDASHALIKIKRFLSKYESEMALSVGWPTEEIAMACEELWRLSNTFRYVVETEFEVAPYLALALIGWDHYLPRSFLQALHTSGVVVAPAAQTTTLVRQGAGWPTYQLSFAWRPLPESSREHLFSPYNVKEVPPDASFDVSHGVSREKIQQNLNFFSILRRARRQDWGSQSKEERSSLADAVTTRLCIVLWLKAMGLFDGCESSQACEERFLSLEAAPSSLKTKSLRLPPALEELKATLSLFKKKESHLIWSARLPSFMENHVLRQSALLKLFESGSLEEVHYTLQTISAALMVLPEMNANRPKDLFCHEANQPYYQGEAALASLVMGARVNNRRPTMDLCFRIVSCEIGYRTGHSWGQLDPGNRTNVAQSVVSTLFLLLADFPDRATEMLLIIVDVALEQLRDKQSRAEFCSTIAMTIGFQDSKAIHCLMIPLFELMGDNAATRLPHMVACHNIIIKHEPKTVITTPATTKNQRALLLKDVAREVVFFRDVEKLISSDVASTWLKCAHSLLSHIQDHFPEPASRPQLSASKIVDDAAFSNPFLPIPRLRSKAIAPTWTPSENSSATTRCSLFRERGTGASHNNDAGRHGSSLETITPRDDMLLAEQQQHAPQQQQQRAHLSHFDDDLANAAIDVSKIVHIVAPTGNIMSGWQVLVKPGLSCSLVRDHGGTLRIVPFKDLPLSNSSTDDNPAAQLPSSSFADMTTCCHFEDYGEAWEFCFSRKHPSTLVGEGFLLTTSERGGWQILLGLAHGVTSASLRPWHILAFHSIIHFELCGPSESGERGGRYQLMEWLCRRVCRGLEKDMKQWKKENVVDVDHPVHRSLKFLAGEEVQDVIIALTTSEGDKQDHYCFVIQSFLEALATKIREKATSVESQVIEEAIVDRLRSASQADNIILEHCGVRERVAMGNLVRALSNSLQFLSSSADAMSSIAPGPNVKVHHESTKLLFGSTLSTNDVRCQLHEVLDEEAQSNRRALDLINDLYSRPQPEQQLATEFLASEGNSDLALFTNVPKHQVDDKLRLGTGLQTGGRDDIFFGLAQTYDAAELQFHQIERKEKYHHSTGLLVGVVIDKRLVGHGHGNHALVVQWVLQVLRSPLPLLWREWLILHLRVGVVGLPAADRALNFQLSIIVHLLAWRCEVGSVREILCSAFGELPPHCVRNNRVYGVIAMSSPSVKEWVAKGYDVQEQDFTKSIPDDEEAFRHIVKKFGTMTTHVVVYGYDKEPMSDILLKWLCEYTFRYPWRFFVLVDCDTTSNLPENRDRVTNLMSSLRKRQTRTITLPLEEKYRDWTQFIENLPAGKSLRSCSWSYEVERHLRSAAEATERKSTAGDQILLIHLISPPGGGKSTLLQDLANRDIGQFVRFDCSDDRLVEEALRSLLNEGLAGIDLSKNTVLVVDEYHMFNDRKKHEFMQWAADNLSRVKIVLIANRADPLDKMLLEQLHASHPLSKERIRSIEGRISALKVHTVIEATYNNLDPDSVKAQSKKFYTFLSTLRGMLGDDAVSLRFEEHFPRFNNGQKVNNIEFTKRLLDKLIMFGQHSILRILDSYEQLTVLLAKQETIDFSSENGRLIISRLYKDCLQKSPIKLLVFTSLLVPLLLYKDPTATRLVQPCDEVLSYRDVVEGTPNLRLAPVAVRLMMWVLYVQKYVGIIPFDDSERRVLYASLRRLDLVDFPDFPIIMKESSIKFYAISKQKSTFVNHNDLTDLNWIYKTLARRMAVNWSAIQSAWKQTPVTDSDKLCAIIEIAGPTTVLMAMETSNVLQLLKRNPSGAFHDAVMEHYPLNRIRGESSMDESPYFFAVYSDMVQQRPLEGTFGEAFASTFVKRILRTRGLQHDETALAKSFLAWISNCGSLVATVPNFARERSESVVRLVVTMSQMLSLRSEEEAAIWRGKYLAPVAELFAESKMPLIPVARAVGIVAGGVGELLSAHDKWPPSMKLLHRVISSKEAILSEREAIYLLESGVLDQPVPPRLAGALLQAEPPGWLPVEHQLKLLSLDVSIGAGEFCSDERYIMNARRNVLPGLRRRLGNPYTVKLRCKEIQKLFSEMQRLQ